jgi:hypothetical protein
MLRALSHQVVMIVRYIYDFFIGALVERRILLCGLAVGAFFVLTFAFSSWHEGLWRSDAAPSTRAVAQPREAMARTTDEAAPAAAAMNPSPAIAPPEPVQSEPYSTPDVDNGETENGTMRHPSDRAAEHGARTH